MCAIYAFMRRSDDLSDDPGASRAALERWSVEMEDALEGRFSGHPVWPAFHHTVRRFGMPHLDIRREPVAGFRCLLNSQRVLRSEREVEPRVNKRRVGRRTGRHPGGGSVPPSGACARARVPAQPDDAG